MPTPSGLPKAGERWRHSWTLPVSRDGKTVWESGFEDFTVISRGGGEYWSMRVRYDNGRVKLLVDPSYWLATGNLKFLE
jgi:hypothetical protein